MKTLGWLMMLSFLLMTAGCSTEVIEENSNGGLNEEEAVVTLHLTTPEGTGFGTRSDGTDAGIDNLYLVAVPQNISDAYPIRIYSLRGYESLPSTQTSASFSIVIYPGKYQFYVLGNIDSYLSEDDEYTSLTRIGISEAGQLTDMKLYFSQYQRINAGNLPMVCYPSEITAGNNKDNNNYVNIPSSGSVTISATVKYICSKVRYTILFDNSGISSSFGDNKIEFYGLNPYATNIRRQTSLNTNGNVSSEFMGQGAEEEAGRWYLELDRFKYPDANKGGENYPQSYTSTLDAVDDLYGWDTNGKRAWQGVIYLPENNTSGIDHTILKFPYKVTDKNGKEYYGEVEKEIELFSNGQGYTHYGESGNSYGSGSSNESNHGLARNVMYDVVAKVKTMPDDIHPDLDVTVYVSEASWDYEGNETVW